MRHRLHLFPFRIHACQLLSIATNNARETIAKAMQQNLHACKIDVGNIYFIDEAYFALNSFVNKQYLRIWGTKNIPDPVPSSLHPQKS